MLLLFVELFCVDLNVFLLERFEEAYSMSIYLCLLLVFYIHFLFLFKKAAFDF